MRPPVAAASDRGSDRRDEGADDPGSPRNPRVSWGGEHVRERIRECVTERAQTRGPREIADFVGWETRGPREIADFVGWETRGPREIADFVGWEVATHVSAVWDDEMMSTIAGGLIYTPPNRPSSFWPASRVTIAFFQSEVRPVTPRRPVRLTLPRIRMVLTATTLMPCAS